MADTVDVNVVFQGTRRYAIRLTNISDGTGESNEVKLDISTLIGPRGREVTYTIIEEIEWNVQGFTYVLLEWDHTVDDEIDVLSGAGYKTYIAQGGLKDPQSSGGTGDILLTTGTGAAGSTYDIYIVLRLEDN